MGKTVPESRVGDQTMAEKIMIIRHGEKPDEAPLGLRGVAPPGIVESGEHSRYGLTVRGWQRAGALAVLFAPEAAAFRPKSLSTPNTIFASAIGPHSWSRRMQLTIEPLRQKLGQSVVVNTIFFKGDEERMINAALACSGNVLICWAHETLPRIGVKILGTATGIPPIWPDHRYDLVWVFDWRSAPAGWSFLQVPQLLLSGDSSNPLN